MAAVTPVSGPGSVRGRWRDGRAAETLTCTLSVTSIQRELSSDIMLLTLCSHWVSASWAAVC